MVSLLIFHPKRSFINKNIFPSIPSLQFTKMNNVDDTTIENRAKHNTKWHVFQIIHAQY